MGEEGTEQQPPEPQQRTAVGAPDPCHDDWSSTGKGGEEGLYRAAILTPPDGGRPFPAQVLRPTLLYLYVDDVDVDVDAAACGVGEPEQKDWGREFEMTDPDGNRLRVRAVQR